jgi:phage shock protein PspC (stress-responsive transcriptional regulator)
MFGGVCGGLAAALRVNAWLIRLAFVVLSIASLGIFAALYLMLWWLAPQESLLNTRGRGLSLFFIFVSILFSTALWAGRDLGWLISANGASLWLPVLGVVMALVFFARQVKA